MIDNAEIPEKDIEKLLQGLYKLLKKKSFVNTHHCDMSEKYFWLLPIAVRLCNILIRKKSDYSFDSAVLDLFLNCIIGRHYVDYFIHDRDKLLEDAKGWEEFKYRLFWYAVDIARDREKDISGHSTRWWQVLI